MDHSDLRPDAERDALARQMAEMRHIQRRGEAAEASPFSRAPVPYQLREVRVFENVMLDPSRPVLKTWKATRYDNCTMLRMDSRQPPGKQHDAGDGFGVVVGTGGPFKVRALTRPKLGAVLELDAISYWLTKSECSGSRLARFEPVPDSTPLRGPIFPASFPSDPRKARQIAERALRKQPGELDFAGILKFWQERKTEFEVFKL